MKPATKTLLESRIRILLSAANDQEAEASEGEMRALGLRKQAEESRAVAAELQSVLDNGNTSVMTATETQGVGGRMVEHVDAPESEDAGLPAAVWVFATDLRMEQIRLASDSKRNEHDTLQYLMQLDFLDDAQRAKYQGEL